MKKHLDKKFLLKDSKTFCMLPWVHLQVDPNGDVKPCCLADFNQKVGSLKENSLKEIWNNEAERELRRNMLSEKQSALCARCYEHESAGQMSTRRSSNKDFSHHFEKIVTTTEEDGTVPEFHIKYMDIRFSNICNFRCRTCGPQLSSRWHRDMVKIYPDSWKKVSWPGPAIIKVVNNSHINWEEIEELLPNLEEAYFAGGEPLIMEEHYQILKLLADKKLYHVKLRYNTNFSEMKYKKLDVMKIWNEFETVEIGASLDGAGKRGEYIRKDTKWEKIEENRRRMLEVCPDVSFWVSCTVSLMNAWHLPDFHRDWVEKKLIRVEEFHENILLFPEHYRVQALPARYKDKIREKYLKYLDEIKDEPDNERALRFFQTILTFMDQKDLTCHLPDFREYTRTLDRIRNERFEDVFPEYEGLMDDKPVNFDER